MNINVNDKVRTPFGIGYAQGYMRNSIREVVLVRILIDESNKSHIRDSNVIGNYNENSHSALWCFYPNTVEVIHEKERKIRNKKG